MAKSEGSIPLMYSEEGIDRISSLPEALLSHILSLLPTKRAVATSLLSTRWKFLWTSITNLNFDDGQSPNAYSEEALNMKRMKFTQFVNRVLLLLNPPCIQFFCLRCHHKLCDPFYLDLWICAAIRRNVQKLELHLVMDQDQPMELPLSHFYCNTLTVLKLNYDIHFNVAASASICFPNLLTLHLSKITFTIASDCSVSFPSLKDLLLASVKYANEESVHKLFASCPILDNLVIKRGCWDNVHCLIISIPSLRSLKTSFWCFDRYPPAYKLRIDTPTLKYLYMDVSCMCEYLIVENLSCLLEARVKVDFKRWSNYRFEKREGSIFKFIGGLFNVKFLSISGNILKVIGSISEKITPVFRNLTRLELSGISCRDRSVVVKKLLESMDNLEHLVMRGSFSHDSHESLWTEPLSLPMCLLQRLTTISFTYVIPECGELLELVRYFLKNAEVLELLTVDCFDDGLDDGLDGSVAIRELMQKILMIPRGSRSCQVDFK